MLGSQCRLCGIWRADGDVDAIAAPDGGLFAAFSVGSRDLDFARVSVYAPQLEPLPKMRDLPCFPAYIRKRAPISTRCLDPPRRPIGELIAPL